MQNTSPSHKHTPVTVCGMCFSAATQPDQRVCALCGTSLLYYGKQVAAEDAEPLRKQFLAQQQQAELLKQQQAEEAQRMAEYRAMAASQPRITLEEYTQSLTITEGHITDMRTNHGVQNLNSDYQNASTAIGVGLALAGQAGGAALAALAGSDADIDVTTFAIEVSDAQQQTHVFKGTFPEAPFGIGDHIQVIAEPTPTGQTYANAIAVVNVTKQHLWAGQEVRRGRTAYRLFSIKFGLYAYAFTIVFSAILLFFMGIGDAIFDPVALLSELIFLMICLFIGWRVGASFDEQSIVFEAIASRLGFYKPSRVDLGKYTLVDCSELKEDVADRVNVIYDRKNHYTFVLDKALADNHAKYKPKP